MPLRPGTRGIVGVRPMQAPGAWRQTWSCSICGRSHSVLDSWVLSFRHDDGPEYDFVVCPACADEFQPLRPEIDLARVEALDDHLELRDHVRQVLGQRSERPQRYLRLRDADVRDLASSSDRDARSYLEELSSIGVAVDDHDGDARSS